MEVPPPQLPALPDRLNGLNLLQYVAATASENRDAAIQNQMNPQFLFALGIAAWIKCEIHIRIMLQPNPNAILSNIAASVSVTRLARIARQYYIPVDAIVPNETFSDQDAVFGLLTYWGLVGVQENDEDARLYDWLTQVIEWEIFQQVNDLFATI